MKRTIQKSVPKLLGFCLAILTILSGTSISAYATSSPTIWYCAHVADLGWMSTVTNGATAGTTGQSKRMEAIQVDLSGVSGGVTYRAHVADLGWLNWVTNRQTAGTTGQSRRMEAVQIKLTGDAANYYDIVYRAHVANLGWLDWVKNGQTAGTTGQSRRIEAIQIKLVSKGSNSSSSSVLNNSDVQSFINDPRWKVGTLFDNSVTGQLTATKNRGWGCNAYARDFVYSIYGKSLDDGTKYTSISEIRAGDAIYLTPQHWEVVLARSGNTLDVIHGNWTDGKVCRSTFTISGNNIGNKTFSYGYHY